MYFPVCIFSLLLTCGLSMSTEQVSGMSPVLGEPVLHFHQVNSADQQNQKSKVQNQQYPQERSIELVSIGWIAAGGMLVFAFVNTILLGATVMITFNIFQWLLSALALVAPAFAATVAPFFAAVTAPLLAAAPAFG
ncbi:uncharacterized protein LOC111709053 [Eurytemora carolleeae]|uniref:uncharacterized protein LOC111709053 n=1 Tax=Eurytemora carolleeae TaxID=1294199 RepID=UPI000C786C5D|nr:uncharacterized protein LOC111709053 [Eurytemora carolleeae]|eukprot:XP_023338402.1 uncharacterized protein LOC111709053 [Eurytemora affinis]